MLELLGQVVSGRQPVVLQLIRSLLANPPVRPVLGVAHTVGVAVLAQTELLQLCRSVSMNDANENGPHVAKFVPVGILNPHLHGVECSSIAQKPFALLSVLSSSNLHSWLYQLHRSKTVRSCMNVTLTGFSSMRSMLETDCMEILCPCTASRLQPKHHETQSVCTELHLCLPCSRLEGPRPSGHIHVNFINTLFCF